MLTILGSTGSVGQSTLSVVAEHPDRYQIYALTANRDVAGMASQVAEFSPQYAVMASSDAAEQLEKELRTAGLQQTQVLAGPEALARVASDTEVSSVMSAIVGAAGLQPTLASVMAGKRVLIANKEPLVMTGEMFMRAAKQNHATILPIDSEHNAVFQCLPADADTRHVRKVHLTASGGPFRGRLWSDLKSITPAEACAHPNWSMGPKISVDSATMMNKGLELIEATALFDIPATQVEIVVHPQSIIHSLVEYCDGSFLAQLGAPDMRIPIAHAMAWPERHSSGADSLDLTQIAQLNFEQPDMDNLPCLRLAREAAMQGGSAPTVLNAANEVAVEAFLQERIGFNDIPILIEKALESCSSTVSSSLEDVLKIDNEVRRYCYQKLDSAQGFGQL